MRIGIDARFFGSIGKGLGRYTQKLVGNLEKIDKENEYFVFLGRENFAEYIPQSANFKKILAPYAWYSLAEQIKLPSLLHKYKLDLMHFPHFNVPLFYRKKFIVTIHDLILLEFPTRRGSTLNPFLYRLKFWAYRLVIWLAIRRAQKIITVSNFTKKEILKHYAKDVGADKIQVTYEAGGEAKKNDQKNAEKNIEKLKKYGILKPYILYVGNAYPHKNLEKLVLAFSKIHPNTYNPKLSELDHVSHFQIIERDDHKKNVLGAGVNSSIKIHLVLAGRVDYFYNQLIALVQKHAIKNVVFAGHVHEEDLASLYQEALVYVFPSLYEGFGIPPLEAMAQNIPVAASNHPCMQEILGESAYFFDAQDEKRITAALAEIIADENLRKKLTEKGAQQIQKYSWQKMAQETLKIYLGS